MKMIEKIRLILSELRFYDNLHKKMFKILVFVENCLTKHVNLFNILQYGTS